MSAEKFRRLGPRGGESGGRGDTLLVQAGRVAKLPREKRSHRHEHAAVHRRRRGAVQIDSLHQNHLTRAAPLLQKRGEGAIIRRRWPLFLLTFVRFTPLKL